MVTIYVGKKYCPLCAQERNLSQTDLDSQEREFQDNVSTTLTHGSEISMTTDESETEKEMEPWIPLIEEAKQRRNIAFEKIKESLTTSNLDEQSAIRTKLTLIFCLNSGRNWKIFIWSVSCG